jgi:uncharacterized protein (TIGR02147 family)
MMPVPSSHEILKAYLDEKIRLNPRLSLRSISKKLKMSVSHLSRVLSGKNKLSIATAERVGKILSLAPHDQLLLVRAIRLEHSRDPQEKADLSHRISSLQSHREAKDDIEALMNPQMLALLCLPFLKKDFHSTERLARSFGVKTGAIDELISKLEKLQFLEKDGSTWKPGSRAPSHTSDDIPKAAIANYHKGALRRALQGLDHKVEAREFQSLLMPVQKAKLAAAKARLRLFVTEFQNEFCSEELTGDGIYELNMSLYPLAKATRTETT